MTNARLAYLADHRVYQQAVLPATAYLEMALAAGASVTKSSDLVLDAECVLIQQALVLPDGPDNERPFDTSTGSAHRRLRAAQPIEQTIQIILTPEGKNTFSFEIYSLAVEKEGQETSESPFRLHASGKLRPRSLTSRPVETFPKGMVPNDEVRAAKEGATPVSVSAFYQECSERGLDYGPTFQALTDLSRHEGEAWAKIRDDGLDGDAYHLHPALLDACLQLGLATRSNDFRGRGSGPCGTTEGGACPTINHFALFIKYF